MSKTAPLFFVFLCAVLLIWGCTKPKPQAQPDKPAAVTLKKEIWTCPMHPQIKKQEPGQCPICGMTLVKVDEDQASKSEPVEVSLPTGHDAFHLSLSRQQLIGVRLGEVEKKPLFKEIHASGRLAFDPEMYTAQNEYLEALRQMTRVQNSPLADVKHSAQAMVRSAKLRLKVLGLSDKQISQLGTKEDPEASLLLNKPGQQAWVYADIFEMDLQQVQTDQAAEVTASFLGGERLAGKVVSVDRVINPQTRTAKARILVSNARAVLRPESFVDVTIHAPMGEQVTVPFDSVLDTGREAWVFLSDGKGYFEPRKISVKFRAGDNIAVESGLKGGEKIVTSANFLIDSESRLRNNLTAGDEGPTCPKGQHWDTSMAMCMPDAG